MAVVVATLGLLGGPVLAACSPTTYDASIPSDPPAATTTTLPTGTAATLLPRLLTAAGSLSAAITTRGDKVGIADQVQSLWNAASQEVAATRPELLGDFEANVAMSVRSAQFNRAADADKAFQNLTALVTAYDV